INPKKNVIIKRTILTPHNQKNEYLIWRPISKFAKPSANHNAGEKGLTKVPTIFPTIMLYAVARDDIPKESHICSATWKNATKQASVLSSKSNGKPKKPIIK